MPTSTVTRRVALAAAVVGAGLAVAWATAPSQPAIAQGNDAPPYADPGSEAMNQTAPDVFDAVFTVQTGDDTATFTVRTHRAWAPLGADRFYSLVKSGYFNDQRVFRVVPGFVAQFGIHGDPSVAAQWRRAQIADDPIRPDVSNTRGRVVFANAGPDTRTTQLFINFGDNTFLDDPRAMRGSVFAPFGEVTEGMNAVDAINSQYGEQPNQGAIQTQGNAYLDANFPELTRIVSAVVVDPDAAE
ncbi:MAG: peptidylprolyl isomerase [Planctomycetota bacterium]